MRLGRHGHDEGEGANAALVDLLQHVRLFEGLERKELERISGSFKERTFNAGDVVALEGSSGIVFFVIESGTAKATIRGRKGGTMGPGECFGEMALLHRAQRSATVTAESDMHLLVLNSREFSTLMDDVPSVARKVLAAVAERLREAERPQPHH
jgi:CRP/FNR family transcriptional regulator, cyclic AMP receptor protein